MTARQGHLSTLTVQQLLADAKRAAGERAEQSANVGDYTRRDEWVRLATDIDALLRRSIEVIAGVR